MVEEKKLGYFIGMRDWEYVFSILIEVRDDRAIFLRSRGKIIV